MSLLPSMLSRIACNLVNASESLRLTLTDLLANVSKSTRKILTLPAPAIPAEFMRLVNTWDSWVRMVAMASLPILPELSTIKAMV
ncbi:hypothetical protein D3C85_1092150 [compost metagenome]